MAIESVTEGAETTSSLPPPEPHPDDVVLGPWGIKTRAEIDEHGLGQP